MEFLYSITVYKCGVYNIPEKLQMITTFSTYYGTDLVFPVSLAMNNTGWEYKSQQNTSLKMLLNVIHCGIRAILMEKHSQCLTAVNVFLPEEYHARTIVAQTR